MIIEKRKVFIVISLEIETNKTDQEIKKGLERGIYRGLDSEPYNIAQPKDINITTIELK